MKHPDYNELARDFRLKIYKTVWGDTLLPDKTPLDYINTYHYFHQVKHLAENALTELRNLCPKVEGKPKP